MQNIKISPYKIGSASARILADTLSERLGQRVTRLFPDDRCRFRRNSQTMVVNWGLSRVMSYDINISLLVNQREAVRTAANKLHSFDAVEAAITDQGPSGYLRSPAYSQQLSQLHFEALALLHPTGKVVCRDVLTGHSGNGIRIVDRWEDVGQTRLMVQMIEKSAEYRVHIFHDAHLVTQKRRRNGARDDPNYDEDVRSVTSGWVQSVNNVTPLDDQYISQLKSVVWNLGLDFCAVDLALDQDGVPYILELNTAPGIEHTTVRDFYVDGVIGCYEE